MFLAGMIGALAMTALMWLGVWMQWTPLGLESLLGSLIIGKATGPAWIIGFAWHLVNGGLFALGYAFVFRAARTSGPTLGATIGVAHWLVAGLLLGIVQAVHPLPIVRMTPSYFIFWWSFGTMTFWGSLILHVVYGAIVGSLYRSYAKASRTARIDETTEQRKSA